LWRDRRFRSFWAGQTISQFGDRITDLAIPLIAVSALQATAWQVSWLTALVWAPNLLALWIGSWIDQHTRQRRILVAADLLRAVALISIPIAHVAGAVSLAQLYVVVLVTGLGGVLFTTAYSAFFVHLVQPSSYLDANSKLSTTQAASSIGGPAIAGFLVQAVTASMAVAADAISFLASAVLVWRAAPAATTILVGRDDAPGRWHRVRAGMSLVVGHPVLRASLCASTTINFFTFLTGSGLTVLYANRTLGLTPSVIGLAFGVGSLGALLGAVAAPAISGRLGVGPAIALGSVLFPAPIALMAAAGGPVWLRAGVLATAEFLSCVGVMLFDVNLNTLNAAVTPDGLRARVAGAYSTVNYGVRPLAALLGGVLATELGLRSTLLIAAAGGSLSILWILASPIPHHRPITTPTPVGRRAPVPRGESAAVVNTSSRT
jgi:MFS family permease